MPEAMFMRMGEGQRSVDFPEFVTAMGDFLGLLREYDSSVVQRKAGSLIWRVTTLEKAPAPVVGVTPFLKQASTDAIDRIERELIENVSSLTERGERPRMLSDASMRRVQRIAQMTPRIGASAIYTRIKNVAVSTSVTINTLKAVEDLTRVRSTSFGTINGSLDAISVHKGKREFRVWDEQTGRPVRCFFVGSEEVKVKDLLGQKVTVLGMVKADKYGRPISMKIEDFFSMSTPASLPTIKEMRGLLPNFTGGLSLREYFEDLD